MKHVRYRESYRFLCPVHAGLPADGVVTELHFERFDPVPATGGKSAHTLRYEQTLERWCV